MKISKGRGLITLGVMALLLATGCSTTSMKVVEYPSFWEKYDSPNVLLLGSAQNIFEPGYFETDVNNATITFLNRSVVPYEIINYTNSLVSDNGGQRKLNQDELYAMARERGDIDYILLTTIDNYNVSEDVSEEYSTETEIRYVTDRNGEPVYDIEGNLVYRTHDTTTVEYFYTRYAQVSISATLVDVPRDTVVWQKSEVGMCESSSYERILLNPEQALISCALKEAVPDLLADVRAKEKKIKVEKSQLLSIYGFSTDGWVEADTFYATEDSIMVTLAFPDAAHHNPFVLDIVEKGKDSSLVRYEFLWDKNEPYIELKIPVSEVVSASKGATAFEIRLLLHGDEAYSKPIQILEHP